MLPSSPISEAGFATRKELLAKFREGWRLVEGHSYRSDDWAILVVMPTYPKPVELAEMLRWVRRVSPPAKAPLSNHAAASQLAKQNKSGKLTEGQKAEIRARVAAGEQQWRVALHFGVARSTISIISAREPLFSEASA